MRILVVGAGSTGGFFGARLAQAGRDVTFLVRPAREQVLRENGLRVLSSHGDFSLAPRLVTADSLDGPYDLVLLTVKAYALEAALDDLAPAIGPDSMILPVLNGMHHVDAVTRRFGAGVLLGGVCKIASTLDAQGRIVQYGTLNELAYGEMDGSQSERIQRVDECLRGAGFDARLSASIHREMWEKWILLASLGGITCLMRGSIGEVVAAPQGSAFALRLIDEVVAVVRTVGEPPSEAFLGEARRLLTLRGSPQTSSMYRDLIGGHPVEAEQIIGDLLQRGQQAGLDTPLLQAVYVHLSVYQQGLNG
ncbi:2-dehydropantoate 2-reductase [Pseudomonas sp. QL9]|uniref:2-dehydropantoate 2-reductase n=1 Tax=Pseudomonas knackmussii (strain DSM 6978 / CCUG 54928 / LMG 23759 / B13) TaxID=1301098 RepID=A0A024HGS6_PSEKB|nr:2-dehydropantoate 2-reductase [Pseudomonas knackmussii]CDF84076.1 2-dehydropantoate 2-reductase [Pseudomonas knackmussii B13]